MSLNITIDDTSPLVMYSSGGMWWDVRQNASDPSLYNGTVHQATSTNATAALDFSGSSITVYGRSNRGYIASVDSTLNWMHDPPTNGSNILFHQDNLDMGFHTVYVGNFANFQGPELDFSLDRFVVGARLGETNATLEEMTIESHDPAVRGFGNITTVPVGRNGTSLYATGEGSGIAFNFTGASLAIYSPPWTPGLPPAGQYSIYLNSTTTPPGKTDKPFMSYPGSMNGQGELRFFANGLPQGEHRVAIVNANEALGFDYATYTRPDEYVTYPWMCWSNCSTTNGSGQQTGPGYKQVLQGPSTSNGGTTRAVIGTGTALSVIGMWLSLQMISGKL
ncbi:hypothetical protein IAR55_002753 [Kwoniella newhampshirensis]|uniref:Uncharacterized protein n=1 Tax=Kwoniella newhampshirensis TaxID=1651941 RepID=A0AAW0YSM4_9TREE